MERSAKGRGHTRSSQRDISLSEAFDRYMLSEEELSQWEEAFDRDGIAGLQAKKIGGQVPSRKHQRWQ